MRTYVRHGPPLVGRTARARAIDRVDRPRGRAPSLDGGLLGTPHGLTSAHAERHAARGGLGREQLEALVAADLSVAQIAARVDRSTTTVRHWLRYHGLATTAIARREKPRDPTGAEVRTALRRCRRHGMTRHVLAAGGSWRCSRCNVVRVTAWRRRLKERLVREAGGACALCGYDRCVSALQFHHLDPAAKRFSLSHRGLARAVAEAREEAQKCVLLCANCHAEVEAGVIRLPG